MINEMIFHVSGNGSNRIVEDINQWSKNFKEFD